MAVETQARPRRKHRAVQAAQVGAALQAVCLLLPLLDLWVIGSVGSHVQAAYPSWGAAEVDAERNAIVIGLVAINVLGLCGWLLSMWVAHRGRAVRATVTTLFALGMLTLVTTAGTGGGAYEQIVPLWLGLLTLALPALPGVGALIAAWSERGQP